MATKIRLKRIGRRNRPFYRMVVMDSRNRRDGAAIEELGWYNPIEVDRSYDLKGERVIHWLGEGAQPTEAAHKLLRRAGIAHQWHLIKQGLDEVQIEKEMKKWEMNREDVQKARADRAEKKADEKEKAVAVEVVEAPVEESIEEETPAEVTTEESSEVEPIEDAPTEEVEEAPAGEESTEESADEPQVTEETSEEIAPEEESSDEDESTETSNEETPVDEESEAEDETSDEGQDQKATSKEK